VRAAEDGDCGDNLEGCLGVDGVLIPADDAALHLSAIENREDDSGGLGFGVSEDEDDAGLLADERGNAAVDGELGDGGIVDGPVCLGGEILSQVIEESEALGFADEHGNGEFEDGLVIGIRRSDRSLRPCRCRPW